MESFPFSFQIKDVKEGSANKFRVEKNIEVCVIRKKQRLWIFRNRCPHMGAPINEGWVDTEKLQLQCPWHGYCFNLDTGEMMENPNSVRFSALRTLYKSFKPNQCPNYRLTPLKYEVSNGIVRVFQSGT